MLYPHIDPIAFSIGPLQVHWYGLMYLLGFLAAWLLGTYRAKLSAGAWNSEQVIDLIYYAAFGVIIGGRLGYMLFYYYPVVGFSDWLAIFRIWDGGMSFHGGLLGVLVALWFFSRHTKRPFSATADFIVPLVPLGLGFGRIGNFINGELWGRPTDLPWGMVFPHVDQLPRHPSQLYEVALEGVVLFCLVWWFSSKKRPPMAVTGVFLIGYAFARSAAELFREPDQQIGFLAGGVTMGQLLSLPLLLGGIGLLFWAYRKTGVRECNSI